ncbi:MAG TPA: nucleotidyltransferase family protein [Steroidobacteraceae bacterium]|jgi:molybdenum cofactor cytidylyltransferase
MNANPAPGLGIIVLAAGFSLRLGQPKALASVRGASLLKRMLELAAGLRATRIIVVVPRNASRYRLEASGIKAEFVVNLQRAQGLSSSVRRGVAAARYSRAVLLIPADLARLKAREMRRLISRWRAAPRRLVARRIGQSGGAPLILPRWLFPKALGISGDAGLRELVRQLPIASLVLVDLPSAAFDVDTTVDLKIARRTY